MTRQFRKRLFAPESLEDILVRAGEDRFSKARPPISRGRWARAVGARIAERSEPMTLENGVLTVRVASHAWASELGFMAEDIRERLRAANVSVKSLQFRVGTVEPPRKPPERRTSRRVPAPMPVPAEILAALENLPDEDLRQAIKDSCSRNLAWSALAEEDAKIPPREPRAATLPSQQEVDRQSSEASRSRPSRR